MYGITMRGHDECVLLVCAPRVAYCACLCYCVAYQVLLVFSCVYCVHCAHASVCTPVKGILGVLSVLLGGFLRHQLEDG